jgi:hypothetical protein
MKLEGGNMVTIDAIAPFGHKVVEFKIGSNSLFETKQSTLEVDVQGQKQTKTIKASPFYVHPLVIAGIVGVVLVALCLYLGLLTMHIRSRKK